MARILFYSYKYTSILSPKSYKECGDKINWLTINTKLLDMDKYIPKDITHDVDNNMEFANASSKSLKDIIT